MRHFALLFCTSAALALSACSHFKSDEDGAESARKAGTVPASAPVAASAQEQKEMSAVMGGTPDLSVPPSASLKPSDDPAVPAVPVEPVSAASVDPSAPVTPAATPEASAAPVADAASRGPAPANAPKECPGVEVLPDTKSLTYFDDPEGKPTGAMVARASLVDIKGGCDYTDTGVIVDIDMIMKGRISDKGRYEGRKDLEAFMTFPYFVAVMDPAGKMIDKKIMATAMRFKPEVDDLDHAEKITQNIPLGDVALGPKYTITVGFQLNRAQLDYNRGKVGDGPKPAGSAGTKKTPAAVTSDEAAKPVKQKKKAASKSEDPLKDSKAPEAPKEAPAATTATDAASKYTTGGSEATQPDVVAPAKPETAPKPATAPAADQSSGAKMTPIVE